MTAVEAMMVKRRRTPTAERVKGGKGEVFYASLMDLGELRGLSADSVRYLGEVAKNPRAPTKSRVSAAKALLLHHQWREDYETDNLAAQLAREFGNDLMSLAWLRARAAEVEARIAAARNVAGAPPAPALPEGAPLAPKETP